jgi:hypothetical protein
MRLEFVGCGGTFAVNTVTAVGNIVFPFEPLLRFRFT